MPSIFRKNFHLCCSKISCLPTSISPPLTLNDEEEYFCHIPTNSITIHNNPHTFNSIYDNNPSTSSSSTAATTTIIDYLSSTSFSTSSATEYPDLSAIFASQRLFISSPGLSNSILEPPSSSLDAGDGQQQLVGGGVPIKKDSPDPYADFRRSMQEMIEARDRERKRKQHHVVLGSDADESDDLLEYLQELLLCYLNLNPQHAHKFIIGAFADLLVALVSSHSDESNDSNRGSRPQFL